MLNILVCFDNNDFLLTRINCTLKEAEAYYISNYFDGKIAKFVLDIDMEFKVSYSNNVLPEYSYGFHSVDYESFPDIILYNNTLDCTTTIEPAWLWKSDNRIITQPNKTILV